MKTLEKGQDKIKKICEALRDETLQPAKKEAHAIILAAQKEAEEIIAAAEKESEKIKVAAKVFVEQEQNVFHSSLQQAAKQSLEVLRQNIENRFFNDNLATLIDKNASNPQVIANLISAMIKALEKDGLAANLTALIPTSITPKQINELLLEDVLKTLKDKSVSVGSFSSGAQVRLNNKKMTLDITEEALKELLAAHVVRKDFRSMIFAK